MFLVTDIQKSWSFISVVQHLSTAPEPAVNLASCGGAAEAHAQTLQTSPMVVQGCCPQLGVGLAFTEVAERKMTVEEEEAKRIAEMGKPILGEHPKLEVIIEESYEFKVSRCPRDPPGGESHMTLSSSLGEQD